MSSPIWNAAIATPMASPGRVLGGEHHQEAALPVGVLDEA